MLRGLTCNQYVNSYYETSLLAVEDYETLPLCLTFEQIEAVLDEEWKKIVAHDYRGDRFLCSYRDNVRNRLKIMRGAKG
jgi:hypothetical protein